MHDSILLLLLCAIAATVMGSRVGNAAAIRLGIGLILGLMIVGLGERVWIEVPPGHVAVRFNPLAGGIQDKQFGEGWHVIAPWESCQFFDVRTQEYSMTGLRDEQARGDEDAMVCQTSEGLRIKVDLTVLFHIDPNGAPRLWRGVGANYVNTVLRPSARNVVRLTIAKYPIMEVYSNADLSRRADERAAQAKKPAPASKPSAPSTSPTTNPSPEPGTSPSPEPGTAPSPGAPAAPPSPEPGGQPTPAPATVPTSSPDSPIEASAGVVSFPGKRQEVEDTIQAELAPMLAAKGIIIERVLLRSVSYDSPDFEKSIVAKQVAQQSVVTQQYRKRIAEIQAQAQVERARGQAEAIRLRGEALRQNSAVVGLEFVQKLPQDLEVRILPQNTVMMLPAPVTVPHDKK